MEVQLHVDVRMRQKAGTHFFNAKMFITISIKFVKCVLYCSFMQL